MSCNWKLKKRIADLYQTQADFGEAAGLSESAVSQVVRFRRKLPDAEQRRWSRLLRCTPEDIFFIPRIRTRDGKLLRERNFQNGE